MRYGTRWIDRSMPHLSVEPAEDGEPAPAPPNTSITADV